MSRKLKKAINQYCFECYEENAEKTKNCPYNKCPLWKYRLKKEIQRNINLQPLLIKNFKECVIK